MYRLDFRVSKKAVKITYIRGIYNPKLNIYTAHSVWAVYTLHVNDALRWMKRWLTLFMKPRPIQESSRGYAPTVPAGYPPRSAW